MSSINFKPPLIAHRGASAVAPENTLASFLKAKRQGAVWIEFDVMLAACGEAVVIHDETLDRTTNGSGKVSGFPYSYIATLDAGSWFSSQFAGEHVPTFKEVIAFLHTHQMSANVEIKAVPGQEAAAVKKILSDIECYWQAGMLPPLISSFSIPILRQIRQQSPHAQLGVLIHEWFEGWQKICEDLQSVSVNLNQEIITPLALQTIKAMDKLICAYTVNQPHRALELFSQGVDAVFTDRFGEMVVSLSS